LLLLHLKAAALLRWAREETAGCAGDVKPYWKRAFAIANAYTYAYTKFNANAIANAINIANGYAHFCNEFNDNANANDKAIVYANTIADTVANTNTDTDTDTNVDVIIELIDYANYLKNLKIFKNTDFTMLIVQMKALKTQIPGNEQPKSVHESFAEHLIKTWLHAFNLTSEMVNLSKKEIKALENYLYANRLIIDCKEAAVRLAPLTWEGIEERMLKVN
jgi:hypothetical protein